MKKSFIYFLLAMSTSTIYSQEFSNPEPLFDPSPYGFSHVALVPSDTKLIFVAGQGGEENKEGRLSPDFRLQVRHALQNIQFALKSQGLDMNSVVKVTTLVVDHDAGKLQVIVEEFEKIWPKKNFPVNTLIPVPRLALDNMQIEIDAIAVLTGHD
ncbi:MAG: RidA family protein [Prolixibacteraceae bacterium]